MPKNKKILIADDDPFLGSTYKVNFQKTGHDVEVVGDGNQVMASLEEQIPDVVILDLIMPRKDEFTVLEEIRKSEKFKSIPVIVSSNLGQKEDIERGMELGANDYVIKSNMTMEELIKKVEAVIK
jgi:DNA-binding response OmpR family regulator